MTVCFGGFDIVRKVLDLSRIPDLLSVPDGLAKKVFARQKYRELDDFVELCKEESRCAVGGNNGEAEAT